ncbi:hypothetical protein FACS1894109_07540 [Spirochaetia bacterium]|nr:hypothetical protein FACS1894109_07540 [Spirochaetia bacterium]
MDSFEDKVLSNAKKTDGEPMEEDQSSQQHKQEEQAEIRERAVREEELPDVQKVPKAHLSWRAARVLIRRANRAAREEAEAKTRREAELVAERQTEVEQAADRAIDRNR